MATASDRAAEHARARSIEKTTQHGAGMKKVYKGPAYGGRSMGGNPPAAPGRVVTRATRKG